MIFLKFPKFFKKSKYLLKKTVLLSMPKIKSYEI